MRTRAKVDANQAEVTKALRRVGATVQPLHTIGKGCPDLLVGYRGRNYLFEVKDGSKVPSAQKLTGDELDWHSNWRGAVWAVNSIEQAIAVLNAQ